MSICPSCQGANPQDAAFCGHCGASVPQPAPTRFSPGSLVGNGRYRIECQLGEGGMGTVHLAADLSLDRPVALKVLLPQLSRHPTARSRMEAEAKAMARLSSHHVVRVNSVFDEAGLLVIDLEYMPGGSLADLLAQRDGVLDLATAVEWIGQVLKGLEALHHAGLVHRDLKPANVLVDQHRVLKVTDLGVARDSSRDDLFRTRNDAQLGTPAYMAPEQVQSAANVDRRADLYSAGILLYELLVGHAPFLGEPFAVMAAQVNRLPDLAPIRARSLALAAVVERALEKDPAERFQTVGEMSAAVRRAQTTPAAPRQAPVVAPPRSEQAFFAAATAEERAYAEPSEELTVAMPWFRKKEAWVIILTLLGILIAVVMGYRAVVQVQANRELMHPSERSRRAPPASGEETELPVQVIGVRRR
ncbi:MAG: serine/threonine-protein kinase [Myxococcota bacterium]